MQFGDWSSDVCSSDLEGRPSTEATLTARLIDRPIRPMFAEGFRNEVQVTNIVMSVETSRDFPCCIHFFFIIDR